MKRAADDLIGMLEKSTNDQVLWSASRGLKVLAPRLEPAQAGRAADALIAIHEKSKGGFTGMVGSSLQALAAAP